jgi:ABC-type transport system involved in cytochrome c biogenesis permease component
MFFGKMKVFPLIILWLFLGPAQHFAQAKRSPQNIIEGRGGLLLGIILMPAAIPALALPFGACMQSQLESRLQAALFFPVDLIPQGL